VLRLFVAIGLGFAVLASAVGLAYYGWSYTAEDATRERDQLKEALNAVADEKMESCEGTITQSDTKVFAAIDPDKPLEIPKIITDQQAPVVSVFLLDSNLVPIASGFQSKRPTADAAAFRDRFLSHILPTLPLRFQAPGTRGHVHGIWDDEELMFSYEHRIEPGRDFYIVLETDLKYLVGSLFPQYFASDAKRLYQVVDESGELVYGTPFETSGIVVDLPFQDTVENWRLRVAQRDVTPQEVGGKRKVIDIVLIGLAFAGIVAGLGVLLFGMQRERKANELKSDFISNVSHELKTPLSIISMFGEMLALGRVKTPEQATEYAEIIWRESVRLARLIDNVLDFAKIERGKDVYEFEEGDVAEVTGRAIELSQHRLQKAEMTVETDIAEELPTARIDANAFTLAVMNLIDNAIKYAADGKKVRVELHTKDKRIELIVRDFGPGIDPAEHARVFERFYRARAVRLKPIRGSGIGLALVEHIAKAHGGGTWVESELGKGAAFGIWIPCYE
jgi:two-component system phosphate regulon sensor histidine kinase PhoR